MHDDSRSPPSAAPAAASMASVLAELVAGYGRRAALINDDGTVLCMNTASLEDADAKSWPPRAVFHADGKTFTLTMPDTAFRTESLPSVPRLPPRLIKIARMVIAGCTDRNIAVRTGLTFSTVRTYVRQIYRRLGVHNRVELVHAGRSQVYLLPE